MLELIIANLAKALFTKVSKKASRMRKERAAGRQLNIPEIILDRELKKSLQILRSGAIEISWWKKNIELG